MPSTATLPVLPLRDIVAFPLMSLPLLVGRPRSLKACGTALRGERRILLLAQRDSAVEEPAAADLHSIGTIAVLVEHQTLAVGRLKLLVRGECRARIVRLYENENGFAATTEPIDPETMPTAPESPSFSFSGWKAEGPVAFGQEMQARVADLQRILEDETLGPIERLRAASQLLGG